MPLLLMRPTTENYEITPPEKILDPRNTHEKKSWTHKIPTRKKLWTHEIPTRK